MSSSSSSDGSDDDQTVTLAISGLSYGLSILAVSLRFYTRKFTKVGLGWDDWLLLAAVILTTITAALLLWGASEVLQALKGWREGYLKGTRL